MSKRILPLPPADDAISRSSFRGEGGSGDRHAGKPEKLLRRNYLLRGVALQPGTHTVEFRFTPPVDMLYVSLAALAIALGLCGFLAAHSWRQPLAEVQK